MCEKSNTRFNNIRKNIETEKYTSIEDYVFCTKKIVENQVAWACPFCWCDYAECEC